MTLAAGSRVGVYEVLAPLGVGGMGEVYRARDTRLKRDVAIKILPEIFAANPERLARFEREAQLLASLNHPHIAQIYGLEGRALVMELVEGETLAARIARGPVPLDEALSIARQIAEALEAAHEQGIVHRDLKPTNIKLAGDSTVKVLDFGLAKLSDPNVSNDPNVLSMSPTITSPALMTGVGMLLGTASYMSPEQARGRPVDKRSDVWAFGCVLFEMLASARAFDGDDIAEVAGAVIHREPDWSRLPAGTPAAVRLTLQRCLAKDPKQRLRDMGDVQLTLTGGFESREVPARDRPSWWVHSSWILFGVSAASLAVGAALGVGAVWRTLGVDVPRVVRWPLAGFGTAEPERGGPPGSLAITPDGSKVVYVGNNRTQVFVRPLDDLAPVAIASGGLLRGLFISPDGQWVGFIDNAVTLKKVAITGGPAVVLTRLTGAPRGATWLHDDTIVFATLGSPALQRVPAVGGTPTVLVEPDTAAGEVAYGWPQALPGGRSVLFTVVTEQGGFDTYRGRGGLLEAGSIAVLDVETMTRKVLVRGGNLGKYVRSGHLVYVAAGAFWAAPFDLGRLELTGPAVPVLPKAGAAEARVEDFAIAADGTLVYRENATGTAMRTLVWVDRAGMETAIAAPPRAYEYPAISPDGTKIAVAILDQENDIWVWDLRRERLTRATFDSRGDTVPVWTPDGARLVFASQRESGNYNLWWQAADGSGTAERPDQEQRLAIPHRHLSRWDPGALLGNDGRQRPGCTRRLVGRQEAHLDTRADTVRGSRCHHLP